jgi:hypothetical protein
MIDVSYYELLGVTPSASRPEIREAYLRRARALYAEGPTGASTLTEVNEAWQVLSDSTARRTYDENVGLASPEAPPAAAGPPPDPAAKLVSTGPVCQRCWGTPAARVSFGAQRGRLVYRTLQRAEGYFCRHCGQAIGRRMTDTTLTQGWWGTISFVWNFVVLAGNIAGLRTLGRLAPPTWPNGPGANAPYHPGQPLYRRAGIGVAAVAVLIGGVVIATAVRGHIGSGSGVTDASYGTGTTLRSSAAAAYGGLDVAGGNETAFARGVDAITFPQDMRPDVEKLVGALRQFEHDYTAYSCTNSASQGATCSDNGVALTADQAAMVAEDAKVRQDLGLPAIDTSNLSQ